MTGATTYNVYFGTSTPPPQVTSTSGTSYSPTLSPSSTYYWSVTAVNAFGSTPSAVWSFTTASANACSFTLTPGSASLPATGTSTVEICPNNSGQPNCGVYPETPRSFTVTPSAACGPWTATSSSPGFLQVLSGASGSGPGTVTFAQLTNTHNGQQSNTITVASANGVGDLHGHAGGKRRQPDLSRGLCAVRTVSRPRPRLGRLRLLERRGRRGPGADGRRLPDQSGGLQQRLRGDGGLPGGHRRSAHLRPIHGGGGEHPGRRADGAGPVQFADRLRFHIDHSVPESFEPGAGDGGLAVASASGLTQCFQTIIGYPANTTPVSAPNNEFQSTGIYHTTLAADHTNALYVQMVYFVTLNRDPDPGGFAFWVGIANQGGPGLLFQGSAGYFYRDQILGPGTPNQGFIGSPEFQGLFAN